jgi:hypothetical protein
MIKSFLGMEVYRERSVANFNTMPREAAEIYTLSFSIPDLIRREVKLNEKGDSYLWLC